MHAQLTNYNLRCRSILHQSNHPTNQFTTHKIHSLPKWASDELTAWLKKSTSQRTTKYLNFWSYVLHLRCKVDIRTRHISLLLSTQCIQGVHELLHSSMEICNQDLAVNIYDCLRLTSMLMVMKRWWPENSLPISEYQTKECWISIYSKLVTNKHTVLPVCCSQDRFFIIKHRAPFAICSSLNQSFI